MTDRAEHFEELHRATGDPWNFRESRYERRKYAITVASLPRERYAAVWEPGCSIGELTRLLAGRADRVDASDISPTAVRAATGATAGLPGVSVRIAALPDPPPGAGYDLVVLSEVLYYLPADDRERTLEVVAAVTVPGADLVVVHWRHDSDDVCAPGDAVNQEVRDRPEWTPVARHIEDDFILDVLTRAGARTDTPG